MSGTVSPKTSIGHYEVLSLLGAGGMGEVTRYELDDSSGPAYAMVASYDVSPDGQRFIMRKHNRDAGQLPAARIVLNWFEEINRITGTR